MCNLFGRLAVQIILARMLVPEALGQVVYLLWAIEVFSLLVSLGLQDSLTRFLAELHSQRQFQQIAALTRWVYVRYLAISLAGAAIFGVLFFNATLHEETKTALPILIVLFFLQSLATINFSYLTGQQKFSLLARLHLISSITRFAGMFAGMYFLGAIGALLGSLAGPLFPAVYSLVICRGFSTSAKIDPQLRHRLWKYALNTWAAKLVSVIIWSRTEIFFIERYWGAKEVAMFTVGLTLATMVQQVAQLFSGAFLPHFAGLIGAGEHSLVQRQYMLATKLMALLVTPLSLGGAAICPVLVPLIFGENYASTAPNAMVLMITAGLSFSLIGSSLVYAKERSDFIAIGGAAGALLSLAAGVLIIPRFGVWGAVWSRLFVQSSMIILATWFITRKLRLSFPFRAMGRIFMAGMFCGIVAFYVINTIIYPILAICIAVPFGAMAYLAGLRTFHALGDEEASQILRINNVLPTTFRQTLKSFVGWMAIAS